MACVCVYQKDLGTHWGLWLRVKSQTIFHMALAKAAEVPKWARWVKYIDTQMVDLPPMPVSATADTRTTGTCAKYACPQNQPDSQTENGIKLKTSC